MRIAFVNSRQDKAGLNIRLHLEQLLGDPAGTWQQPGLTCSFFDTEDRLIHAAGIDRGMDADLIIFISRHASVNPIPVLTAHVTGNYRAAELGGTPETLTPAAPVMMQAVLRSLARHCPEGYQVAYEVTHHGPTGLSLPSFFVEIGSTEKEWIDPVAGRAVAESILTAMPINAIPLIGFGGTHYAVRETDLALTTRGAFGHIAHTREIPTITPAMIRQMQVMSGSVAAYIDRKALNREDLNRLLSILDELSIPTLSGSEILAMGSLSWERYRAVRELAETITQNARCYVHGLPECSGPLAIIRANPDLIAETAKSDEPGLISDLANLPVVHVSTQNNRLLPDFITNEQDSSEIINDLNTLCVKIIRSKQITATENDHLVITKVRFDPEKARNFGIQPGPAYKQLAAGRQVEVDGRIITPDLVSSCSEIRLHIPGLEKYS
ncbi:MAG: D-tyrosyl-tRNA(Tyr) deacylase [Methanoregula sp.]|jgi:D-aminoacyl-tRNA deacylase|nr:D-tyrosyl-tRNA(Tyr) deacylase [Methanoregula sp.]